MALAMFLVPMVLALLAALVPSNRLRPLILPLAGLAHLVLVAITLADPWYRGVTGIPDGGTLLNLDAAGMIVLAVVSVLFCIAAFYAVGYLRLRQERNNRVFVVGLLGFL